MCVARRYAGVAGEIPHKSKHLMYWFIDFKILIQSSTIPINNNLIDCFKYAFGELIISSNCFSKLILKTNKLD